MSPVSFFLRVLLFVATFAIEVRVKADTLSLPLLKKTQMQPEGCLKQPDVQCALRVPAGKKFELNFPQASVVLDQETSVVRLTSGSLRLIEGTVWVRAKDAFMVVTEYGSAGLESGDFWVTKANDRVLVSAIKDTVTLYPRGSSEALLVEPGLENWLGRIASNGRADTGVPVAISLSSHMRRWARMYTGKKSDFEKEVLEFGAVWKQAKIDASEIHQALAERKIANLDRAQEVAQERRKREEIRNRELSDMLRKKISGELD